MFRLIVISCVAHAAVASFWRPFLAPWLHLFSAPEKYMAKFGNSAENIQETTCWEIPMTSRVPCPDIGGTACGTTCVDAGCCYDPDISIDVQCFKKEYRRSTEQEQCKKRHYWNSCYVVVTDRLTWDDAQQRCIAMGGHLADIDSFMENYKIFQLVKDVSGDVYMDGQDTIKEGEWRWATSGSKMRYTNWNSGEPNNHGGEDCLVMLKSKPGKWNDVPCNLRFASLCEIKEKPICDKTYKNSCYVVVNERVSWKTANSRCNAMGGHLADINDSGENEVVRQLAAGISDAVWIDGKDTTEEGVWRWATTSAKMSYTKWYSGEPNDAGGEDCAFLYHNRNGAWNDVPCDIEAPYACKIMARPRCDRKYRGSCYIVVRQRFSWHGAKSNCKSMGGQLADISDSAENDVIQELAIGINSAVHIDATDILKEGTWRWSTSGLPLRWIWRWWDPSGLTLNYNKWNKGEPNNHGGGEDCAQLYHDRSGKWNDIPCHISAPSVCEIKGIQKRDLEETEPYVDFQTRNLMCDPLCQNGGACSLIANEYMCVCDPGYTGDSCETELGYRIATRTAKHEDAGSDDEIYLTLIGDRGQCDEAYLSSVNDDFQVGSTDHFRIGCGRPIGNVKALSFRSSGKDGWHVEKVNVTTTRGTTQYTCTVELSGGKDAVCHV